jgi:hypothetical protein
MKLFSLTGRALATVVLAAVVFSQVACGFDFATGLRTTLAASGPLIESLPISQNLKAGTIADFTELGGDVATMVDSFKKCDATKGGKPCKLDAVLTLEGQFETIDARGHFGAHAKLQTIEGILKGLIASAKIFYGGKPPASAGHVAVTEQSLKSQLDQLKTAMQP